MARVLVPGGQLMIYVWAMEQKNRHFEKQDVLVPCNSAFCSPQLSEPSQCARKRSCGHRDPSRGHHPSCPECLKDRCDSKRSHSMDCGPGAAPACCGNTAKEGEQENGFYNTWGKSFRSWFSSRSLDESTLRKQIERVKSVANPEGWPNSAVSTQPSRHPSLDFHPPEPGSTKEPSTDEDVFVDASSQGHSDWPRVSGASRSCNSGAGGQRSGAAFLDSTRAAENRGDPGNLEGGPSARMVLRRVSAVDSMDSSSEDIVSAEEQQPDFVDSRTFMRYYHVFREGELCSLLRDNVAELRILSSGNDHGNWCVIAEKRGS